MRTAANIIVVGALSILFAGCNSPSQSIAKAATQLTNGGDAHQGKTEIRKYGCNTCHTISGVPGAQGLIGPPLDGIGQRYYLAGELTNSPDNLMLWIRHPHQVEPHTLMPEMGVTEQDSRDIAAYLYTLNN